MPGVAGMRAPPGSRPARRPVRSEGMPRGRKLVVQMVETFREHMAPAFVEKLDAWELAESAGMALPPVMIYGDDVSHILTEEGIANLLLCRTAEEREQAIRGVAGYTPVGLGRDKRMVENLRDRGVIRRAEDLGVDKALATRDLLAARSVKDLVRASGGLRPAQALSQLVREVTMETLEFEYRGGRTALTRNKPVLSGVLGSGNLEVLVEPADLGGACQIVVETAAVGFGETWRAVLDDVFARWPVADVRISINDAGATPAVVSLRLDQALKAYTGGAS